jgi:hypothetical protein
VELGEYELGDVEPLHGFRGVGGFRADAREAV